MTEKKKDMASEQVKLSLSKSVQCVKINLPMDRGVKAISAVLDMRQHNQKCTNYFKSINLKVDFCQ